MYLNQLIYSVFENAFHFIIYFIFIHFSVFYFRLLSIRIQFSIKQLPFVCTIGINKQQKLNNNRRILNITFKFKRALNLPFCLFYFLSSHHQFSLAIFRVEMGDAIAIK